MLNCIRHGTYNNFTQFWQICQLPRHISSQEVNVALRPFYFAVHPDLFGKYPDQRATNEDSLQRLSAHLESLQKHQILPATPDFLPFYVRSPKTDNKGNFTFVKVPVDKSLDTKRVIVRILKACNLSTETVDKIETDFSQVFRNQNAQGRTQSARPKKPSDTADFATKSRRKYNEFDGIFSEEFDLFASRVRTTKENESLGSWLKSNYDEAKKRLDAKTELIVEVDKLKEELKKKLELKEIIYDCGWNVDHFRGCLKSLERLQTLHKDIVSNLKGRTLVFGSFTGVSLEGNVILFTGDVQRNWLDLMTNIRVHDVYLTKIPAYEYALSQVLRKIRVARRKFMPKAQVQAYTSHLRKVTTGLLDYLSKNTYPKAWPETLEEFEIVVESEAGPIMVSPTGQFIVPATYPGSLLVDFITKNIDEAKSKQKAYNTNKYIERGLESRCLSQLELLSLSKDDSVTPEKMIDCLKRLLETDANFKPNFKRLHLHITNYYSVLADGTVCVPYDWKI